MDLTDLEVKARAINQKVELKYIRNFLEKVEITDSCWNWMASCSGKEGRKYGCFWDGKIIKAHQFSYKTWHGEISPGLWVLHTCDNTKCVNPSHLYAGTPSQNVRDAIERGRHSNGMKKRTHCPQGHPYSGENLYEYKGQRQCKTCRDIHRGRTPKNRFAAINSQGEKG